MVRDAPGEKGGKFVTEGEDMKLTKNEIGKRVQFYNSTSEIGVLISVGLRTPGQFTDIVLRHDDGSYSDQHANGDGWHVIDETSFFDFSRFGCNEKHVKDLVEALDKRYGVKEK